MDSDSFDVPVDDLDVVTLTRAELAARLKQAEERGRNGSWAEARKTFKAKSSGVEARLAKLEQLVTLLTETVLPGISAPVSSAGEEP